MRIIRSLCILLLLFSSTAFAITFVFPIKNSSRSYRHKQIMLTNGQPVSGHNIGLALTPTIKPNQQGKIILIAIGNYKNAYATFRYDVFIHQKGSPFWKPDGYIEGKISLSGSGHTGHDGESIIHHPYNVNFKSKFSFNLKSPIHYEFDANTYRL